MPYATEITATLRAVANARTELTAEADGHRFQQLSVILATLQEQLREQAQAATRADIAAIITALEAEAEPTRQQLDLIRLWIVGDAEHYVRLEHDYRAWVTELDRLVGEMGTLQGRDLSLADLSKLAAWGRDAQRVLADIEYFKEEEARVQRFETAAKGLSGDDKRRLANILRHKLSSNKF